MSLKDNLPNPAPSPSPSSAMAGTLSQRSPQQTRTKEVPEEPSAPGSFLFGNTRYFELNKLYAQYHNAFRKNKGIADWPSRSKHLVLSYLVDWIVLVMLLALLGLHYAKPPVFYFRLDDPDISYPFVDQTISATAITLVIILGPLAVVAFAQIWVRSMRDFHQSAMATLQLFVITQLICEFMWTLVGGLRPNFLAICKPSVPIPQVWTPVQYYDDSICTCSETELIRAKHAFPSGHAASITAVCVYLAIYVSAKLKVFDNRSHLWKFVVSILAFFVIDVWISFSRIRDGQHHLKDCLIGMIIGAICGPLIYRLNYCSLFGPDNHIPCRYLWQGKRFWRRGHSEEGTAGVDKPNPAQPDYENALGSARL